MVNIGSARIEYGFSYPAHWVLSIPAGVSEWRDEQTESLQSALLTVAEHGIELEVDDWTYQLMVTEGAAPPVRPDGARRSPGHDFRTGPARTDRREGLLEIIRQAPDFVGLTAQESHARAAERNIRLRLIDEQTTLLTLDSDPTRLNLELIDGRVVSAAMG